MQRSSWLAAAAPILLLAGCTDRQPLSTAAGPPVLPRPLAAYECRADVRARTVSCAEPAGGGGVRTLILGGQNLNVRLRSDAVSYDPASGVFSADVTVENLLSQALGTPDGVTPDPEGIRVFFFIGPVVTAGSGQARVANADGTGTFTAAGQPFFRYPGILPPGDTTAPRTWRFALDSSVVAFAFRVFLDLQIEPEVVINEIMAHPTTSDETAGEWFEVYNASKVRIDLAGYAIASGGDAGYTIPGPLVVLPGEHAVFGTSTDSVANGGAPVRVLYQGVTLGNDDSDWLALRAPTGVTVDSVSWGAAAGDTPATPRAGIARSLVSSDSPNVNLSGEHSAWMDAFGAYGPALQRGTPGTLNRVGVRGGISIATGDEHSCMADRNGAAWCWGRGFYQLGTGSFLFTAFSRVRVAQPAGVRFGKLVLAGDESCAISFLGEVYCWGIWNYAPGPMAHPIPQVSLVQSLAYEWKGQSEFGHGLCAIGTAGEAFCYGSVGPAFYNVWTSLSAVLPASLPVSQLALGEDFACALANGRAYCYGQNDFGQLGDGTTTPRASMVEARLPQGVTFRWLVAAYTTACALSDAGQAYCWGRNQSGQLGIGAVGTGANPLPVPVQQPSGIAFTSLSMSEFKGKAMACGLAAGGQAYCWGQNDDGRAGDGTETQRLVPTAVVQPGTLFSAIAVGGTHTCALEAGTGQPFCWGLNLYGQVGDGTAVKRLVPTPIIR